MRWRFLACCGMGLLCPLAAAAQTAPGFTLPGLMADLAQVRGASASYTETKSLPLLTTSLQSSGTLDYRAPDYVRKTTTAPAPQNFVLQNGIVTLTLNGQTQHFTLAQAPQLAGLVEGVRATLAGDLPALRLYYNLSLSGGPEHWQLLLHPRDPALAKMMAWMSITGTGDKITEIDSADAKGGETKMQVRETTQNAP
ncbi:MAG: outer membrane lipoprotein carrier protein LolA [Rhodospirillales bacterium]|nr:outer membrane lipoprotein carrier protein LolA [Rhodospirillales bacterium]MDE2318785.1 outer membrane lipoprotein carrier protein LolA [Rhodospirillales bacterium]